MNAIASGSGLDPALAPIATGQLAAALICGSNSATGDTQLAPVANNLLLPATGRKLAGLHVTGTGIGARQEAIIAGPPAWSWRYDYVRSLLSGVSATVVGAFRDTEPNGAANPPATRDQDFTWPTGTSFQMNVHKFPRQGNYDALYIHPVDTTANPVLSLPVSGDLGLVLVMRQGATEGATTLNFPLLGWGPGRLDGGARTSVGAPLVPPNQHVDLTVENPAAGVVRLTYAAAAQSFDPNDWQVFMEQGLGLGYRYDAKGPSALYWLQTVGAFAGVPTATFTALVSASADTAHPETLDLQTRSIFRTLHAGARLYDQQVDGTNVQQAPEASSIAGAESL